MGFNDYIEKVAKVKAVIKDVVSKAGRKVKLERSTLSKLTDYLKKKKGRGYKTYPHKFARGTSAGFHDKVRDSALKSEMAGIYKKEHVAKRAKDAKGNMDSVISQFHSKGSRAARDADAIRKIDPGKAKITEMGPSYRKKYLKKKHKQDLLDKYTKE